MIANIDPTAATEISLAKIETATNAFALAHDELATTVRALEAELAEVKSRHLRQLRRDVARAADKRSALAALLESAPHLFLKPRTLVFNGIKVGYQKGKGGIDFDDADKVVERIFKQMGDMGEDFVHTSYKPNKEALQDLDVATLKKFGCSIKNAGDEIIIKPTNDVDKIVNALLKDATEEAN
jgi:hypothetical protein